MQTERVTFLTTPDHKAALDAFAASNGHSVGHVLREASSRYLSAGEASEDEAISLLAREIEEAVPRMQADIRQAIEAITRANGIVDAVLSRGISNT